MITSLEKLDLNKKYTYADYLTWQLDEMVELIRGKVFKMSPAPSRLHQAVSSRLHISIGNYLLGNKCEIYSAPFDVRLPLPSEKQNSDVIDTVVQPDLCVICDPDKLDDKGCNGAPEWIIEIISKSTAQKDLKDKFELYQSAGVREYWIVHPVESTVLPYFLNNEGNYELPRPNPFVDGEMVPVQTFKGLEVDLTEVFRE
jgi:Uma2 family endonuclease